MESHRLLFVCLRGAHKSVMAAATRVIAFGCDLAPMAPPGLPVEVWADVPPASEDFAGARAAILSRLEALFRGDREHPNAAVWLR